MLPVKVFVSILYIRYVKLSVLFKNFCGPRSNVILPHNVLRTVLKCLFKLAKELV